MRALSASGQVEIVAEAEDGRAALAKIQEHLPDVALLDYKLPELDGVAVTHAVVREQLPDARAARVRVHRQRRRLQGARDGCRRLHLQGGPPRADRRRRARLLPRRERRPAGRRRRPRLGDPAAEAGRHAGADPARAGDPPPDRRGQEPPGDRQGALPGADDGEDARPAPVREARRLRPGGRRRRPRCGAASSSSRCGSRAGRPVPRAPPQRRNGSSRGCGSRRSGCSRSSESLAHPDPERVAFIDRARRLLGLERRPARVGDAAAGKPAALRSLSTGVDIVAISLLAALSGGPFSHVRLAFFLVPVTVAFRFRPAVTATATLVAAGAYVLQAVLHPASSAPEAARFIVAQAGFLALGRARLRAPLGAARPAHRGGRATRGEQDTPARGRALGRAAGAQGARRGAPRPRDPEPPLGAARDRGGRRGGVASGPGPGRRGAAETVSQLRERRLRAAPVRARRGRARGGAALRRPAGREPRRLQARSSTSATPTATPRSSSSSRPRASSSPTSSSTQAPATWT